MMMMMIYSIAQRAVQRKPLLQYMCQFYKPPKCLEYFPTYAQSLHIPYFAQTNIRNQSRRSYLFYRSRCVWVLQALSTKS